MMTNPANDIVRQAKNGSVAAIIQVLNERLTDSGVRTRAVFTDGILQLLCEAATPEQLDQATLVDRVKHILEAIAPLNIRRVNINSRIVREQQLLWLEEINRDPKGQLLWSQEISLRKPSLLKQIGDYWQLRRGDMHQPISAQATPRQQRERQVFRRGLAGGALLGTLLIGGGWLLNRMNSASDSLQASSPEPAGSIAPVSTTAPKAPIARPTVPVPTASAAKPLAPKPEAKPAATDPFAEAVRRAEQTAKEGKTARSSADWYKLAARWQEASDLMAQVPETDERYTVAQDRLLLYRTYSETALQEGQSRQSELPSP